jgi:hypothetical protein
MKLLAKFLFCLILFVITNQLNAQVTIGNLLDPQEGALLDLKEKEMDENHVNASKGLLFPKVALEAYDDLSPLFDTTTEPQTISSTGMVVYNVNKDATGLDVGLHVWNGSEWIPLSGSALSGQAELEILMAEANIQGALYKNISLTKNNTIT